MFSETGILRTDEFELTLGLGWVQEFDTEPEQFKLWSEEKGAAIDASFMLAQVPTEKLRPVMDVLVQSRLRAHAEWAAANGGGSPVIGEVDQSELDDGQGFQIAYEGYGAKTRFRFAGWVTTAKVMQFFVAVETSDSWYADMVFNEVFRGLRLRLP